jgi:hypothetical protein
MSCPICIGEGSGEAERLQAEGHVRIPLGDGADAVWLICDQHKGALARGLPPRKLDIGPFER